MKCEIVNPSDPYTIEHDSLAVLGAACVLLGGGQYALKDAAGSGVSVVPFFMFGGFDEWWAKATDGEDFGAWLDAHLAEVADAMDSVTLTSGERSSLNDIGGRAREWSKKLRAQSMEGPRAPQQVFTRGAARKGGEGDGR